MDYMIPVMNRNNCDFELVAQHKRQVLNRGFRIHFLLLPVLL